MFGLNPKRPTHREVGAQSHGSVRSLAIPALLQTARLPKVPAFWQFFCLFFKRAESGLAASMEAQAQKEVECGGRQQSLVPDMSRMILDHPYFIPYSKK